MKQFSLLIACCLLTLTSQALHIDNDLDRAQQIARAEGKLVLVKFYASWCGPCKTMTKTLQDRRLKKVTDAAYITVSIDIENFDGIGHAQKYSIGALPTMLFFNSQGDLLGRTERVIGAATLSNLLSGYNIRRNRKAYKPNGYAHKPAKAGTDVAGMPIFEAPQKPQLKAKGILPEATAPPADRKRPMKGLRRRIF